MKKVMMGVGLGLATMSASQAHAWAGDIEDMRTMQANKSGTVVKVKSSRVECCRLRPVRAHGHAHQTKRIHNGRTYYCSDATAQHRAGHHAVKRQYVSPRPQQAHNRNHQQALQAQRAKRQAMYAAQAKRKAQLLAQQRKRAAMLEQQKRRKIQLAQQQQRAAHQAAMLAAKKRQAAQLIQQKRRAAQLAQQRRQQAQKRQQLLAQQKRRTAQQRTVQQPCNCAQTRKPVRVVQPRVHHRQQVIARHNVVQQYVPREKVISRRIITTHVQPSQMRVPARTVVRPRVSSSQRLAQQSVTHHDRQHSRSGWQQTVQAVNVPRHVQYTQPHVQPRRVAVPVPAVNHEAKLRQQRLQQIRAAQIAAQRQRQQQAKHQHRHTAPASSIKMAPIAPYVAPTYVVEQPSYSGSSSYTASPKHNRGWQRGASVNSHGVGTGAGYEMYEG